MYISIRSIEEGTANAPDLIVYGSTPQTKLETDTADGIVAEVPFSSSIVTFSAILSQTVASTEKNYDIYDMKVHPNLPGRLIS